MVAHHLVRLVLLRLLLVMSINLLNEVNKTIKDAEKALTLAKKSGNKKDIAAAQSLVDLSKGELSDLVKLAGSIGAQVVQVVNRYDQI
jgi:hypothetical protein